MMNYESTAALWKALREKSAFCHFESLYPSIVILNGGEGGEVPFDCWVALMPPKRGLIFSPNLISFYWLPGRHSKQPVAKIGWGGAGGGGKLLNFSYQYHQNQYCNSGFWSFYLTRHLLHCIQWILFIHNTSISIMIVLCMKNEPTNRQDNSKSRDPNS